jgi:YVTN family beta-propeller protein
LGCDDTVSKINAATGAVAAPIAVGDYPLGICFDGVNIWVVQWGSGTVRKI